jgi:hypothetical protein
MTTTLTAPTLDRDTAVSGGTDLLERPHEAVPGHGGGGFPPSDDDGGSGGGGGGGDGDGDGDDGFAYGPDSLLVLLNATKNLAAGVTVLLLVTSLPLAALASGTLSAVAALAERRAFRHYGEAQA